MLKISRGKRGADRMLQLTSNDYFDFRFSFSDYKKYLFENAHINAPKTTLRKKLARLSLKLRPKKPPVTFYTLRY